jgi:Caspase domain/FG-GAP repeat
MAAAVDTSRRRALLVASGTYSDAGLARLRAPAGDVDALAAVLGDASIGGFEVRRLVDRPTDEIRREIEGFFAEAARSDLLLLYFSGHGVLSQSRRFYFATATTALGYLRTTAIDDGFVNGLMHESRARSIVLVLDCCHSGAFGKGLTPKSAQTVDVEHHFDGDGRVTLSASTALEYAFEADDPATGISELEPAPGSLFTSCLVDGLRSGEADIDGDGVISVNELYDYARKQVRRRSPYQTPGIGGDQSGDIVIARTRERPQAPPPRPPPPTTPVPPTVPPGRRPPRRVVARAAAGAVAAAAAIVAAVVLLGGSDPPGRAAPYDFDRDGRQEIVLGAARAIERDGTVQSGAVVVHGGPEAKSTSAITAAGAGVPGPPTQSDRFGAALAGGDFDRDGEADLAVGAPGLGLVTVLYGPQNTDRRPQLIKGETLPSPPTTEDFGFALLAADFDRDGFADLAIGAPGSVAQRRGFELGSVHLIPGAAEGLEPGRAVRVDAPENGTGFGSSLAAGDLDRDGDLDLVTGSRDEPRIDIHGHLAVCDGPSPLTCRRATTSNDFATTSLAVADVNDDGYADVVQGDQGSEEGNADFPNEAGVVRLWVSGKDGLGAEPPDIVQGARGIPGEPEDGDRFGHAVEAGDVDGDGVADVVVAAPGDGDPGSVTVIRGSRSIETRLRAYAIPVDDVEGDLGGSLSLLDLDGDELDDLVIAREHATSGDDALVAYMREGNQFGPSVRLTDLDALADLEDSPLRIGR